MSSFKLSDLLSDSYVGAQGTQGTIGLQGTTGSQGTVGAQGIQGITGAQGTEGAQGAEGAQGIQGITGAQGTEGAQGAEGAQGVQGITGAQGTEGAQGTVGAQGTEGAQGVQGITGAQGTEGAQGVQGITGAQGTEGAQGAVGAQGTEGAQGAVGAQGTEGAQGAVGAQGTEGAQGVQGITGAQGTVGAQGVQGITGSQGTIGSQGTVGAQGAIGAQGTEGAQGVQGRQGITGAQGVQGRQGIQGIQGLIGPSTAINATNDSTNAVQFPVFVAAAGSNQTPRVTTSKFTINPSTGKVVIGTTGSLGAGLEVYTSGSTAFDVQGSAGQLFSVTDSLVGVLMSVNDISGIPILEVSSDDKVVMGTFGTNALVVNGSMVGIGSADPTVKLDIIGTTSGSLRMADNITNETNKVGRIVGRPYTNADTDFLAFDIRGLTTSNEINYGGGSGLLNSATSHAFYTAANKTTLNGTERLRIDSAGNVGIGTTAPQLKFVVSNANNGGLEIAPDYVSNATAIQVYNRTAEAYNRLDLIASELRFLASGAEKLRILNNGNVGIGTSSPGRKFEVAQASDVIDEGIAVRNAAGNHRLNFWVSGLTSHIDSGGSGTLDLILNRGGGNVGIGTTSPTTLLTVNGTATATTFNATSTIRVKKNIRPLVDGISTIKKLKPAMFDRIDIDKNDDIGFIAEEMFKVIPSIVTKDDKDQCIGIDYGRLSAVLTVALLETLNKVEKLEERILSLENKQ